MTSMATDPAVDTTTFTLAVASDEEIVTALLAAAKLSVSDREKAVFVADYPVLRAGADALYLPELEFVSPAERFDALAYYPAP